MAEDEGLLYDFCIELLHNQGVSDPTYARMLAIRRKPGIVEAASLEGYRYHSMIMNTVLIAARRCNETSTNSFP